MGDVAWVVSYRTANIPACGDQRSRAALATWQTYPGPGMPLSARRSVSWNGGSRRMLQPTPANAQKTGGQIGLQARTFV